MSNLHQKAIEGVCAEALMRVTPQARVQILRRLLKIAVQDAKRSPEPDPRQTSFEEVFHGPYEKEATAPSMREPNLQLCAYGDHQYHSVPMGTLSHTTEKSNQTTDQSPLDFQKWWSANFVEPQC